MDNPIPQTHEHIKWKEPFLKRPANLKLISIIPSSLLSHKMVQPLPYSPVYKDGRNHFLHGGHHGVSYLPKSQPAGGIGEGTAGVGKAFTWDGT